MNEATITITVLAYIISRLDGPLGVIAKVKALFGGINVLFDAMNCPYCLSFWPCIFYGLATGHNPFVIVGYSWLALAVFMALVRYEKQGSFLMGDNE